MQTFKLKKWSSSEIVTDGLEDLESIFTAITNDEFFILACDNKAEVMNGSQLKNEMSLGNISLKAEY